MKARLAPLYLTSASDPVFLRHLAKLAHLLGDHAEFLEPRPLGAAVHGADAAVLPQIVGDAYRKLAQFRELQVPIVALTSDFATMAMWDWEMISYLRSEGISIIAPYSLAGSVSVCRALAARRELREPKFVVYQDQPGQGGKQPDIFKRFYWWEPQCVERIEQRFGARVIKKELSRPWGPSKGPP